MCPLFTASAAAIGEANRPLRVGACAIAAERQLPCRFPACATSLPPAVCAHAAGEESCRAVVEVSRARPSVRVVCVLRGDGQM